MASIYDFLNSSLFFDLSLMEDRFAKLAEKRLVAELEKYRAFCISNLEELGEDARGPEHTLRMFAGNSFQTIKMLKQAAFYLDAVILPDPLFPFTQPESQHSAVMSEFLEMPKSKGIDRGSLKEATNFLLQIRPMVAAGYVRFFPLSYFSESPSELPIRYSPTQFAELLPKPILDHYLQAAKVSSLVKREKEWIIEEDLRIGRGIAIGFDGDESRWLDMYQYVSQRTVRVNEETQTVHFEMSMPKTPPPENEFHAWVTQSINQSAGHHFKKLSNELGLAVHSGAMYLTNSPLSRALLDMHTDSERSVKTDTARFVVNLDLPYFRDISMEDLMYARTSDGEAFNLFRRELEKQARELRALEDPGQLKTKTENAMHELLEVQATKVAQTVSRMRKQLATDTVIAVGSLSGAVVTSGWTVLSAILAAAHGYKTFSDYQKTIRENPAYFYWKAKGS
jgi:hypothetical protein